MDLKTIDQIISEAKHKLTDHAFDAGHDLAHAEAVWVTAQVLARHLNQPVNLDALKIACFWHDVVVKPINKLHPAGENVADTANFLKTRMHERGFSSDFTELTVNAVRYHQFDDEPVNLEGQILWDADKLEVINASRWIQTKKAADTGQMSQSKLDSYLNTALKWLKVLRPKYHFDYSRELFDKRLQTVFSNPEIQTIAREKGIDIRTLINPLTI